MTTHGPEFSDLRTIEEPFEGQVETWQAVAFSNYQEALLARGLPEPLNPGRQVPRER